MNYLDIIKKNLHKVINLKQGASNIGFHPTKKACLCISYQLKNQ